MSENSKKQSYRFEHFLHRSEFLKKLRTMEPYQVILSNMMSYKIIRPNPHLLPEVVVFRRPLLKQKDVANYHHRLHDRKSA